MARLRSVLGGPSLLMGVALLLTGEFICTSAESIVHSPDYKKADDVAALVQRFIVYTDQRPGDDEMRRESGELPDYSNTMMEINREQQKVEVALAMSTEHTGHRQAPSDMVAFLSMLGALGDASGDEAFMWNMTYSYQDRAAESQRYVDAANTLINKFERDASAAPASTLPLFAKFFDDVQDLYVQHRVLIGKIDAHTKNSIPKEFRKPLHPFYDTLDPMMDSDAKAVRKSILFSSTGKTNVCKFLSDIWEQFGTYASYVKGKDKSTMGTLKALPMMKSYLDKTRPERSKRVMYLMFNILNVTNFEHSSLMAPQHVIMSSVRDTVARRSACGDQPSQASGHGLPLVSLLAVGVSVLLSSSLGH